jgi:hypothetical protein
MKKAMKKRARFVESSVIKPKCVDDDMDMMALGGSVDEGPAEKANQKGVNKIVPNYDREHNEVKHGQSEARYGDKKAKHLETLKELRSMPKPKLAEGGEIEREMDMQPMDEAEEEHHDSIAAAIMARRRMAEGGQVDIMDNAEEEPSDAADEYTEAALKENYDSDMEDVSQPMDSNEHGDDIDEDIHDMVSAIRRKMRSRMR